MCPRDDTIRSCVTGTVRKGKKNHKRKITNPLWLFEIRSVLRSEKKSKSVSVIIWKKNLESIIKRCEHQIKLGNINNIARSLKDFKRTLVFIQSTSGNKYFQPRQAARSDLLKQRENESSPNHVGLSVDSGREQKNKEFIKSVLWKIKLWENILSE